MNDSGSIQKILLLTTIGRDYSTNYGGVLQAFALYHFLCSNNCYVEVLDYNQPDQEIPGEAHSSKCKVILYAVKKVFKKGGFKKAIEKMREKLVALTIKSELFECKSVRKESFNAFKYKHITFSEKTYKSFLEVVNSFQESNSHFDVFIAGSDQVWNPGLPLEQLKVYLLGFVLDGKKISYASSISSTIPDEMIELYRIHLQQFHAISVREKFSAEEVRRILGYTPVINVDPTILLTSEEWDKITIQPEFTPEKPFIFVYDIFRSQDILPVVEKLSRRDHFKYVNYNPLALHKKRYKNLQFNFYKEGPSEFLWLIKQSDFVVTSSFHGVVFSVLFNKPFYAILWNTEERAGQNDRIVHFLSELGLEDRCTPNPKDLLKKSLTDDIDWTSVSEKLDELRGKSAQWLLDKLNS